MLIKFKSLSLNIEKNFGCINHGPKQIFPTTYDILNGGKG